MKYTLNNLFFIILGLFIVSVLNIFFLKWEYMLSYFFIVVGFFSLLSFITDRIGHLMQFLSVEKLNKTLEGNNLKLRVSEKKFRDFFEQSNIPMAIFNLESLRFVEVNHNLCGILEYTSEEICNMELDKLIHSEDVDGSIEAAGTDMSDNKMYEYTNRYVTKSGKIIKLKWMSTKSDSDILSYCIVTLIHE